VTVVMVDSPSQGEPCSQDIYVRCTGHAAIAPSPYPTDLICTSTGVGRATTGRWWNDSLGL